jgi:hypothetical protein
VQVVSRLLDLAAALDISRVVLMWRIATLVAALACRCRPPLFGIIMLPRDKLASAAVTDLRHTPRILPEFLFE